MYYFVYKIRIRNQFDYYLVIIFGGAHVHLPSGIIIIIDEVRFMYLYACVCVCDKIGFFVLSPEA